MRVIPQLDTYPELVSLVQTPPGKLAVAATFGLLLLLNGQVLAPAMAVTAAVLSFVPQYRRTILSIATLGWLLFTPTWIPMALIRQVAAQERQNGGLWLSVAVGATLCVVLWATGIVFHIVHSRPQTYLARRPVFLLVFSYLCLLATAGGFPLHGPARLAIWIVVAVLGPYLWFFAYALQDSASKKADPYRVQFGTFFPYWVGYRTSPTPVGKGGAFLRRVEAHTSEELAVVQLKAIKLLIWVLLLNIALAIISAVAYGGLSPLALQYCRVHGLHVPNFGVPTLELALNQTAKGIPVPLQMRWVAVLVQFMEGMLTISISGNLVVACVRMSGFNILRNTYKPLYSATIAEFWNRFYFYFKELLVEFFFFPTYIRYFRRHARLRLAAATFAAATLGNLIYHFCRDIDYVWDMGLWRALVGFQVYGFYALVLGSAIAISQVRGKRPPLGSLPLHRRVMSSVVVIGFYCLLGIFNYEGREHTLQTHLAFFVSLFPIGISW